MRYAHLVLGPAGSGKSTYCNAMQKHGEVSKRTINVINLDPAAEQFSYSAMADIRDLVQVSDVMEAEDLSYGPNGALVFCMEYLLQHDGLDWIREQLGEDDDDYILFDCPGQIELYTHMDVMRNFAKQLEQWNFRICVIFLLDSHYMVDGAKFLSGSLTALSAMVKLELPQVNVLSKTDLLSKQAKAQLELFLDPDVNELLASEHSVSRFNQRFHKLTASLGEVLDSFSLVRFVPLSCLREESLGDLLLQVDSALQWGEDADVVTRDYDYPDGDDEGEEGGRNMFDND